MKEIENMFGVYKRILTRHPIILSLTLAMYAAFFTWFITSRIIRPQEHKLIRKEFEIMQLTKELERTQKIVDSLIAGNTPTIFKPVSFEENWENDSNKTEIKRIFEYAEFAMSKNDYKRARSLYKEAQTTQNTYEAEYSLGLISYFERNLESCIQTWKQLVDKDEVRQFPIVRFYLAVVLYEAGHHDESMKYLQDYLNTSQG